MFFFSEHFFLVQALLFNGYIHTSSIQNIHKFPIANRKNHGFLLQNTPSFLTYKPENINYANINHDFVNTIAMRSCRICDGAKTTAFIDVSSAIEP